MKFKSRPAAVLLSVSLAAIALAGCSEEASGGGAADASGNCDPADVKLVGQVRNESNPYEASWLDGGDAFAESVDLTQERLTYDGDSTKQQEQISQILAGDTDCLVMNVLPNGDSDTTPIVKGADQAGAYLVTQWNKPADLNPTDYDTWLSHITYNGVESGQQIGDALAEAIGGSGGIIALQGVLDTAAAKDRFAGLEASLAENPDVELLDQQAANFSRAEALEVTKTLLTKHGDDVKGIWAANDDMALGALEALQQAGRAGEVAVVGIDAVPDALTAIESGDMTATVSSDGPWQGAIGLAIGYCVATGELSVDDIADENRAFYAEQFLITEDNVGDFLQPETNPSRLRVRQRLRPRGWFPVVTMTSPAEVANAARPQPRRGVSFRDAGPPVALIVIFVAFATLSSQFRSVENVQNIMDAAAVLAVVTCGITFVLMMGSIDLSAAGVMGASALTVSLLVANNRNDNDFGLLGILVAVAPGRRARLRERPGPGPAEGAVVHGHAGGVGHRARRRDPHVRRRAAQHL